MSAAVLAVLALAAPAPEPTAPWATTPFYEAPPAPVITMTAEGVVTLVAPPCGTPEASKAGACLRWAVKECPAPPPSFFPPPGYTPRLGMPMNIPVGCDDTWRMWRLPRPGAAQ